MGSEALQGYFALLTGGNNESICPRVSLTCHITALQSLKTLSLFMSIIHWADSNSIQIMLWCADVAFVQSGGVYNKWNKWNLAI